MQIAYSNISTLFCGEMVFRDTPRRVLFELVLPLPRQSISLARPLPVQWDGDD